MSSRITETVRAFYEDVRFPGVRPLDRDGLIIMRRLVKRAASAGKGLRVLDAGCGTGNTLVSLARTLPEAEFVGVDLSEGSLSEAGKRVTDLDNVTLVHHDLMLPLEFGDFEVVLCLGVLHHTADMTRVLRNLSDALRPGGAMYLWMYGKHGRYRHSLNRRLLRMLVDGDDSEAVEVARRFAVEMGDGAPLADLSGEYTEESWKQLMLGNDAWVADQFLHPHEQVVDIESLAVLAASAGLALDEWLGVPPAFEAAPSELRERFAQLDQTEQWLATDLWLKPESYLVQLTHLS